MDAAKTITAIAQLDTASVVLDLIKTEWSEAEYDAALRENARTFKWAIAAIIGLVIAVLAAVVLYTLGYSWAPFCTWPAWCAFAIADVRYNDTRVRVAETYGEYRGRLNAKRAILNWAEKENRRIRAEYARSAEAA